MAGADMVGANSVEKLEDVIVRSAEQVAGQIRAAKEAISTVIFGQEKVVENTLVTILSGGHALLIGVPGLAKTKLVETLGITLFFFFFFFFAEYSSIFLNCNAMVCHIWKQPK